MCSEMMKLLIKSFIGPFGGFGSGASDGIFTKVSNVNTARLPCRGEMTVNDAGSFPGVQDFITEWLVNDCPEGFVPEQWEERDE